MDIGEINEVVIEETDTEQAEHNDIDDGSKNAINTDRLHSMFTEIQNTLNGHRNGQKHPFKNFRNSCATKN